MPGTWYLVPSAWSVGQGKDWDPYFLAVCPELLHRLVPSISEHNSPVNPVVRVEQGRNWYFHFFAVCPDVFHRGRVG